MSFDRWASTQLVPMQVTKKSPQIANQTDCHRPGRRCKQHYAQVANLHRPAMMHGDEHRRIYAITSALRRNTVGINLTKLPSYPPRTTQTKYVHNFVHWRCHCRVHNSKWLTRGDFLCLHSWEDRRQRRSLLNMTSQNITLVAALATEIWNRISPKLLLSQIR